MGIDAGPAPITTEVVLTEMYRAPRSHESHWEIGARAWVQVLKLKYGNGRYLCAADLSLGSAVPIKLLGHEVHVVDDPDALRMVNPGAATGATERLPRVCRECADVLPEGAEFCIKCGAPV